MEFPYGHPCITCEIREGQPLICKICKGIADKNKEGGSRLEAEYNQLQIGRLFASRVA